MSEPSNTDPTTFVHAAKTWLDEAYKAGRWDEHSKLKGGMVTGLEEPFSRSSIMSEVMEAHRQAIAEAVEAAKWDLDHVLHVMETGKELHRRYLQYEGDMDWGEFVQFNYLDPMTHRVTRNPQPLKESDHE